MARVPGKGNQEEVRPGRARAQEPKGLRRPSEARWKQSSQVATLGDVCVPCAQPPCEAWRPESGDTLCPSPLPGSDLPAFSGPQGAESRHGKEEARRPERGRKDTSVRLPPNQSVSSGGQSRGATGPLQSHSHPGPSLTRGPCLPTDLRLFCPTRRC